MKPVQQPLPVGQPRPAARELIYIAGPFNAIEARTVEENIRAAESLACTLVRSWPGIHPVVPHSLGRVLFGIQSEGRAYAGTLALLRRCDAVIFSRCWDASKGSRSERLDAEARGMPIFEEQDLFSPSDPFGHWLKTGEVIV